MKKKLIIAVAFALLVSCTGCASQTGGGSGSGKSKDNSEKSDVYEKTPLQLPQGADIVVAFNYLDNGTLRIATTDKDYADVKIWDSKDNGKAWDPAADAATIPDKVAKDGLACKFSSTGDIYTHDDKAVTILNPKDGTASKTIQVQDGDNGHCVDSLISGKKLFVWAQDNTSNSKLIQYDLQNDSKKNTLNEKGLNKLLENAGAGNLATDKSGRNLYVAYQKGVYKFDTKENKTVSLTGIISSLEPVTGLAVNGKGDSFVARTQDADTGASSLYLYTKTKGDGQSKKGVKLTLYSLRENMELRQGMELFQKANPDVSVDLEVGYTGDDSVTKSDAVRSLNTEVMAGNEPDILLLDGLPTKKYVEKGILEDLSGLVKGQDDLFSNVISATNAGKKIYVIPTQFEVPLIVGKEDLAKAGSTNKYFEIIKQDKSGTPPLRAEDFPSAAINLFTTSDLIKGKKMDKTGLTEFYKGLKSLMDSSLSGISREKLVRDYSLKDQVAQYPYGSSGDASKLYFGNFQGEIGQLAAGWEGYNIIKTVCKDKDLAFDYLNSDSGHHFIPENILGINSKGKHKDAAKKFLEFYLSEQVQDRLRLPDSINKKSVEKSVKVSDTKEFLTYYTQKGDDTTKLTVYKLTPQERQDFIDILGKLDTPVVNDGTILETVMEQAEKYLYDGEDLDTAVNTVCEKVDLYLQE